MTGHRYVNAYNARGESCVERIYLAVSDDGEHWERYGDEPVIDDLPESPTHRISGDPQIVKMGDIYVMYYFKFNRRVGAYNTFAASRDLVHWTRWKGDALIEASEDWDDVQSHKQCVIKRDGVVYHYFCACNTKGERFIALATSTDLGGLAKPWFKRG